MSALLPVQEHIPIGRDAEGRPVFIDRAWLNYLTVQVFQRSGGFTGPSTVDNAQQFEEYPLSNPDAVEALRAVDELRNELASTRSSLHALQSQIDGLTAAIVSLSSTSEFRNRIESIEDRLA